MRFEEILNYGASGLWAVIIIIQSRRLTLYFQQEEYDIKRFSKWALQNIILINNLFFIPLLIYIVYVLFSRNNLFLSQFFTLFRLIISLPILYLLFNELRKPKKISFVYTSRIKRLLYSQVLIGIFLEFLYFAFLSKNHDYSIFPVFSFGLDICFVFSSPFLVILSNCLLLPFEEIIKWNFLRKAKKKIKNINPYVIGITGSYGKTSTKEILFHIVKNYKQVQATPKSYNTLMGICKVINETLKKNTEVFIVEMGAYRSKEIMQICDLVSPRIGIITLIGHQHLERFKTIENIARAKFELIESLPKDGLAVYSTEDSFTPEFISKTISKFRTIGLENKKADLFAKNIKYSENGSSFDIVVGEEMVIENCSIPLLGVHNVYNTLFAVAVAQEIGLSLDQITKRLSSIPQVPHRLQLIKDINGYNIIDDAYNSNPVGAHNALSVLRSFNEGKKILVTPGFVELGEIEESANYNLGKEAASICNYVYLVGKKRTKSIYNGLLENGFSEKNIMLVESVNDAISDSKKNIAKDDTILFLNDLPDLYSEKL
jgi:UDP-N-acetylmuramoyl-tripeptide--D-alanyl-D-alanine ligase